MSRGLSPAQSQHPHANHRAAEQNAQWRARGVRSFLAGEDRGLLHNALKAHNCPKDITANIALDLSNDASE